jgi:putative transcriptional regulator
MTALQYIEPQSLYIITRGSGQMKHKKSIIFLTCMGNHDTLWVDNFPTWIKTRGNMKNKIRELRNKRGISQTELANAVGTTKRTIYAIEVDNSDIRMSLASKLAAFFGCSVDDLFISDDDRHTTADKAMWYVNIVNYTALALGKPRWETASLLERSGLAQRAISGYDVWHTQGYEYMAEVLSEKLSIMEL